MTLLAKNLLARLSPEEKRKPYSKYYYLKPTMPSPDVIAAIKPQKPINPAKAMTPERVNDILKPGYLEVENGYCIMPDGSGFVAVHTKMPGVTLEMYNWWSAWFKKDDLRFKIWYPLYHYKCGYHWTLEDIGSGPEDIIFANRLSPASLGLEMEEFKRSGMLLVDGFNTFNKPCGAPIGYIPQPGIVCHFIRALPDEAGIEMRSRYWMGYHCTDHGMILAMKDGEEIPREMPYNVAIHCANKMAHLASFLPQLYAEEMQREKPAEKTGTL